MSLTFLAHHHRLRWARYLQMLWRLTTNHHLKRSSREAASGCAKWGRIGPQRPLAYTNLIIYFKIRTMLIFDLNGKPNWSAEHAADQLGHTFFKWALTMYFSTNSPQYLIYSVNRPLYLFNLSFLFGYLNNTIHEKPIHTINQLKPLLPPPDKKITQQTLINVTNNTNLLKMIILFYK